MKISEKYPYNINKPNSRKLLLSVKEINRNSPFLDFK